MGLDMYLTKQTFFSTWDDQGQALDVSFPEKYAIKKERIRYVIEDIGYWRKANAIHAWFVKHVQGGVDKCQKAYVSKEDLQSLLDTVNEVLADRSKAGELLPPQSGFFFGSTALDKWYFEDLQDTKKIVEAALKEPDTCSIYYQSSW